MKTELHVTARGIALSDEMKARIEEKAHKLDQFYERITGCHITVEVENPRRRQGRRYKVGIVLTVPGREIVVNRESSEELLVAVRDAFNAAGRRLEDYVRLLRGDVKRHSGVPTARVIELYPERGYGYLQTEDGRQIYFHKNSVRNNSFERLAIGTEVHYAEELGNKGPQATTVTVVG